MFNRIFTSGLGNQEIEMSFTSENTGIAISWFVELLFVLFYVGFVTAFPQNIECH